MSAASSGRACCTPAKVMGCTSVRKAALRALICASSRSTSASRLACSARWGSGGEQDRQMVLAYLCGATQECDGLEHVAASPENGRQITEIRRHGRMFRPKRLFGNGQGPLVERLLLHEIVLEKIHMGQVIEHN